MSEVESGVRGEGRRRKSEKDQNYLFDVWYDIFYTKKYMHQYIDWENATIKMIHCSVRIRYSVSIMYNSRIQCVLYMYMYCIFTFELFCVKNWLHIFEQLRSTEAP